MRRSWLGYGFTRFHSHFVFLGALKFDGDIWWRLFVPTMRRRPQLLPVHVYTISAANTLGAENRHHVAGDTRQAHGLTTNGIGIGC